MLIEGKVYDVSKLAHPGGKQILVDNSGRDATREFLDINHQNAHKYMPNLYIGDYENKTNRDWTPVVEDEESEKTPILQYVLGALGILLVLKLIGFI